MSLPLSVLSQRGPPKSLGGGGKLGRGIGSGGGRIPHFDWSTYLSQNARHPSARKGTGLYISLSFLCNCYIMDLKSVQGINIRAVKGGLDKISKLRDSHHHICHQIWSQNEGLILILAQS